MPNKPTEPTELEELDIWDFVEPCEPDCTPERHAYHQGQWDLACRINKHYGYLPNPTEGLTFMPTKLINKSYISRKAVVELLNLYGSPRCEIMHHQKKHQHTALEDCPVEKRIADIKKRLLEE